tara:strand:+ start:169 stop:2916 length:2748 start_codon:yes stop_codon:yes gene_type:complete
MIISFNEIQFNAKKFAKEWKDAKYEKGETQTFYNEFFEVFGRRRRDVAIYEKAVKKLNDKHGYIDLFWEGKLLVEQKTKGGNLEKAFDQASEYYVNLKDSQKPRFVLVSDFQNFEFYDLETRFEKKFTLEEFSKIENIKLFSFIAGRNQETYRDQDPVNVKAADLISNLFHILKDNGFADKDLEILLTRVVYCLFAEDTGIFQPDLFFNYIMNRTNEDGSDTGSKLKELFQILNTPIDKRQKNIDQELDDFPYINGELFSEEMSIPAFDRNMRNKLLMCADLDWAKVSPALFGSLFQTVMLPEDQRQEGAHYTSEKNILKTIRPLFLDYLQNKFKKIKEDRSTQKISRLKNFNKELSELKILDPACGCGNFLIVSYREIRKLEIEVMKEIYNPNQPQLDLDVNYLSLVTVDQFFGIEINHFATRIAKIALWLVDHQMNMLLSDIFGKSYVRIPIHDTKKVVVKNALEFNWDDLIKSKECSYIVGNPPFVGSRLMTDKQKTDLKKIFGSDKNSGELDYVSCWFYKASQYIKNSNTKVAFVSTNSISQGEQVGLLWEKILSLNIDIFFAHRTFKWTIDEKKVLGMDVANVLVVIIGFSSVKIDNKEIYFYEKITEDPIRIKVKKINPYLVEADNLLLKKRSTQISKYPPMIFGSMPNDGGNLLFSDEDFQILKPKSSDTFLKYIRPFIGAREYISNKKRWCLWLNNSDDDWKDDKQIKQIVKKVHENRSQSKRPATKKLADKSWLFGEIRQPDTNYILIPANTSSKRKYIPFGYLDKNQITGNSCLIIPTSDLSIFAILTSSLHMTWVENVCGRLKDDFRYSIEVVYNNFPFIDINENQKGQLSKFANDILEKRNKLNLSLDKLYDPLIMPSDLKELHDRLDKFVLSLYSIKNKEDIMKKLFEIYANRVSTSSLLQV